MASKRRNGNRGAKDPNLHQSRETNRPPQMDLMVDPEDTILADELATDGEPLLKRMTEDPAHSSKLSAGDLDAARDVGDSGEETVGGSAPTPDQDNVDEIGAAVGVQYHDDEPLVLDDKVEKRDAHRWELDPASAEDYEERARSLSEAPKRRHGHP
jgi:hypothetical protein